MEAGLPRKRGAQSSFRVRTLSTFTSSIAFSGKGRDVPKRPQGCLEPAPTQIPEVKSLEVWHPHRAPKGIYLRAFHLETRIPLEKSGAKVN